jgi:hypothetical protein
MFKCEFCGKQTEPKESRTPVVTQRHDGESPTMVTIMVRNRDDELKPRRVPGTNEGQIKQEKSACPRCADKQLKKYAELAS